MTAPSPAAAMTAAEVLEAFGRMLLIRRFEERVGQLFAMGQINGFCHLSIGREAVIVGMAMAARASDQVITTHRCHGHLLAQGCEPGPVIAELLGRASGVCGGKGGSLHLMSPAHNFFGGHGIVGAPISLGVGLAFANAYRGDDSVCLCTFGLGAADQGQAYEAFNLAARRKLPIVFIIDNDTGEAGEAHLQLALRGCSFDIPGEQVDGIDVRAVREAGARAIARARLGQGPTLLEMLTYPYRGHANPQAGNSAGRERQIDEIDPVAHTRALLLGSGSASEADIKAIDKDVRGRVRDAVIFAQDSSQPVAAALKRDVTAATAA